jgi:hypothetical protein
MSWHGFSLRRKNLPDSLLHRRKVWLACSRNSWLDGITEFSLEASRYSSTLDHGAPR